MNQQARQTPFHLPGVSIIREAKGLASFKDQGCAAALWQRQPPAEIIKWLEDQPASTLPCGRIVLPRAHVRDAAEHLCDLSGLAAGRGRDWLVQDIASLADLFSELMASSYLRLRLDVVETDACRKFHRDAVTARLLCSYRGPGTEYGMVEDGDEPSNIFSAATGSPILLKGSVWPQHPSCPPILHRSPPIEGTGQTRLVLVLDPVDFSQSDEIGLVH